MVWSLFDFMSGVVAVGHFPDGAVVTGGQDGSVPDDDGSDMFSVTC